jgi:MoxR-like ATPase
MSDYIQLRQEETYAKELKAMAKADDRPKPQNWNLSPWAVVEYIMGGKAGRTSISQKYFGSRRTIEMAVATLASDRALLLSGVPGTAKTWVAEHLAAAVCGDSSLVVQATAGSDENTIRYSWNYAELLTKGPSEKAIVPSPVMLAMKEGKMVRIEELTRMSSEVQDALISILSEKVIHVPELNMEVRAERGFNLIATANDRDKGVNTLSSALQRRFNTINMPLPASLEDEVQIITKRVKELGQNIHLPEDHLPIREIQRIATLFKELREGKTSDGQQKVKSPSAILSTAEAISIINSARIQAFHFADDEVTSNIIAPHLKNAVVKEDADEGVWKEYVETVIKGRSDWSDLYRAIKEED